MNIISIENLSKSFADKTLFENINLGIHSEDKIGLIGKNGEGKTTFLEILAGIEKMDSGNIIKGRDINIEYLPQNIDFNENNTIIEEVFSGSSENIKLIKEYETLINSENVDNEKVLELTGKIDRIGAWDLESEAKSILTRLGIKDFTRKVGVLSGGQKRRVALASALINPADLLILDEPTNHLDNSTIEWLEEYLKDRKGALLMVTHDRYFLDRVTNKIIELENKNLYAYEGNYNYYLEKKVEREEMLRASERKRRALYRKELAWMQQGVRARGTRSRERVERFEELENSKVNIEERSVDISVGGQRLGGKILELENVSKSYGDRKIIDDFSYTVLRDDRIGILGDNGAGKTTLMNLIAGKIKPDSGNIELGQTVKIGYYSQEIHDMDEEQRAIEYIKESGEFIETEDGKKVTAAEMMERFLFSGKEQWTPIGKLSGGERKRLYLLKVLMEGPNFLILDEPTNDLDINTLAVLEDYIEEFVGPVLIVSHDRYLLDKLVNKVFNVEDGKVREYPGNYTSFKNKLLEEKEMEEEKIKDKDKNNHKKTRPKNRKKDIRFSYNEQREWSTIHEEIDELEEKIKDLEGEMKEYSSNYVKLEELMLEKENYEEKLEEKLDRWVYLSQLKEEIDRQK